MAEILSSPDRQKIDDSDDSQFYRSPRLVTHADDPFLDRLTELYASVAEPGDRVFDAMSSWRSFLPDYSFERVVGHGLNETELAANDRLDEHFLQDFNSDQSLPLETGSVDLLCCALSVQYLEYPGAVFGEFGRVLDTDGVAVVSFTNRMFPTKAVHAWRTRTMDERATLVERYLGAGGLSRTEQVAEVPGTDPFYAVVGRSRPNSAGDSTGLEATSPPTASIRARFREPDSAGFFPGRSRLCCVNSRPSPG